VNERGWALHLACHECGFDITWHMRGSGVLTTCNQRVTDVIKMSVWGHILGVGFIRQVEQGGTLGELEGTEGQEMECYVEAQGARSWTLPVRWGRLGLVQAGYVRSFSRWPVMILALSERQSAVTRHVWGARLVTWCLGGSWLLLLVTSWRVLNAKWYY